MTDGFVSTTRVLWVAVLSDALNIHSPSRRFAIVVCLRMNSCTNSLLSPNDRMLHVNVLQQN